MAEGLARLNPDGTIGLTVSGTRHTLRQITLGELRELRDLYNDVTADVVDYDEFESRPKLTAIRTKIDAAKTKPARDKLRSELKDLQHERDRYVQGCYARWWRQVLSILSNKALPEADADDLAVGLEAWMVDSPSGIGPIFRHWRAVPLEGSAAADLAAALEVLRQDG